MSPTVTNGKVTPYSLPVAGLMLLGPLLPLQPPMTLEQMTKYRSVSNPLPGPIMVSHQPGFVSPG